MPARALRLLAVAAFLAALGFGIATMVAGLNAESLAARTVDGALLLVLVAVATALSLLIWPRRA